MRHRTLCDHRISDMGTAYRSGEPVGIGRGDWGRGVQSGASPGPAAESVGEVGQRGGVIPVPPARPQSVDITIRVPQGAERVTMLGLGDRNLKMIREALGVRIAAREGVVRV